MVFSSAKAMPRRIVVAVSFLVCGPALGHTTLITPNGGEMLVVGTQFTIEWQIDVEHALLDWDLTYSIDSGSSWLPIAADLPAGHPSFGSIHSFDWMVPDNPSQQVRVRVKMDNVGDGIADYYDSSDADLTIQPVVPENSMWGLAIACFSMLTVGALLLAGRDKKGLIAPDTGGS